MIKKHFLSVCFTVALTVASTMHTQAQTVIGMGTEQPNPNAVLDLVPENGNQGFLAPRLTSAQRQAASFTSKLSRADNGLLVFDINQGQFYYWFNGEWRVGTSGESPGGGPAVSGTTWYTGTAAPNDINAAEGDFYINESTGEVFRFSSSAFVPMGSLKGGAASNPNLSTVLQQGASAGDQRITDLKEPAQDQDAATKFYVDDNDADNQPLDDVLSEGNDAGGKQIVNLASPTADDHAVNRKYVDDQDNAVKQYVDDKIINASFPGGSVPTLEKVLLEENDAGENKIVDLKDPDNPQDAATKNYVDTKAKITGIDFDSNANEIKITEGESTYSTTLNSSAPITLDEGHFFMGNSSDQTTQVELTGDLSIAADGTVTITNLQGRPVANVAPADGDVLQWDAAANSGAGQWVPAFVPGVGSDTPVITTGNGNPKDGDGKVGDIYIKNKKDVYVKVDVDKWKKLEKD